MKCPNCKKAPMTFIQFMLANGPVKTRCNNCQADLKGDIIIKATYYITILIGLLFSFKVYGFQRDALLSILEMMVILIVFIVMTLLLKGGFSWKFGSYIRDWDAK